MSDPIWEPIKPSKEEIEWKESHQQMIDDMLNVFAIPWSMFYGMEVEGSAIILDEQRLLTEKKEA